MIVDEGHCVFARQPNLEVTAGQHYLQSGHVKAVLDVLSTSHSRLVVFYDPDQAAPGWLELYLLKNHRNPVSVRNAAAPHRRSEGFWVRVTTDFQVTDVWVRPTDTIEMVVLKVLNSVPQGTGWSMRRNHEYLNRGRTVSSYLIQPPHRNMY